MFDPMFVITIDDLSPALFRLAQYPRDRVFHLGVIIDDVSVTNFLGSPLGMFLSAQVTNDTEQIDALLTYLALPVWLRGNPTEFNYAVRPYIVNNDDIRPEVTLVEFFDELYRCIEYIWDGESEAHVINVCVVYDDINKFLGTPMGLFWLAQVTDDREVYNLMKRYLGKLRSLMETSPGI